MMKRHLVSFAVLAAVGAAAQPAQAITLGVPTELCISSMGFNHCMSATVTSTSAGMQVLLSNLGGAGYDNYNLTSIAFYRFGAGSTLGFVSQSPVYADLAGAGDWEDGWVSLLENGKPVGSTIFAGASVDPSSRPLTNGSTVLLTFEFLTGVALPSTFGIGFRGQEAYGGEGSFYCFDSGESSTDNRDEICGPPTVVPEPATMALLATGLVGLGGAGLIRRRRNTV